MKALSLTFILTGCAVGTIYDPSTIEMPCEWHSKTARPMHNGLTGDANWWDNLQDPVLNDLITYAACNNLEMRIAALRLQQAQNKTQAEFLQDDWEETWITVSADIAKNYIEVRGFQHRLKIIHQMIEIQSESIELSKMLVDRGIVDDVALSNAQAEWHTLKAQPPLIESSIDRGIHHLSILIGQPPGDLFVCLQRPNVLPQLPAELPIGLPCDLLCRRPNLRKAAREFDLKPTSESRYKYQKSILEALEESENAIASYRYEEEHLRSLLKAYQKYQQTGILTKELIQRGISDTLTTVTAKKTLLSAKEASIQGQVTLLLHYVELNKALGGSPLYQQDFK